MLRVALVCWGLLVVPTHTTAQPIPYSRPDSGRDHPRCTDIGVEPQVVLSRQASGGERAERTVDFTITVFVTNQCPDPLQLQHGSFISYQTNFPPLVPEGSQPPECLRQQRYFSGLVPPRQQVPFAFRVQGCTIPASQLESPQVTLDAGRLVTESGEKPIPAVTEMLP